MENLLQELLAIKCILLSQGMYNKEYFTVPEAALYTDLSEDAIYKLISARKLRHSKPNGKRIYIKRAACDAYMSQNTVRTLDEINQEATLRVNKKGGKW
ncbi:helix-turn-helix domain-containing protein [Pontibacter sp. HSC-14F20]|uniref:helix-turn-helix domain-containing protein n=1 Tax=Pontibacter sp. HSC-14F20 TaxID=2864136 RepID=UPI001C72DFE1|nr:helix-turn-helix domain-containing protein [Pontibacter sp. HSC-14F20]MBX0334323.1 helix-turn-helix domain-containing protein [Pontibacter sp. HSC-14F20]